MAVASVANAQTLGRIDNFNFNLDNVKEEPPKEVVPILRFIDTQNPDGSYTYGYESGDGTYKVNNSVEKLITLALVSSEECVGEQMA